MSTVIKIEDVSKKYIIKHQGEKYTTLREAITNKTKSFISNIGNSSKSKSSQSKKEEFWALKDINFKVEQGERVGIVGRNGAGKSTLLKVLSRITEATTGKISTKGRIASLLEVGTGFHPELTGRENIYLNGAILGMLRTEIKRKFDEIVDFSGIEKFLDTPVKRYSSGMYVRLAFAVAAHLESEILIIDEVLAVGDAEFQRKCLGKMEDISRGQGRTVLFVSHNMGAVNQLCNRGILLKSGQLVDIGATSEIIKRYMKLAITKGEIEKDSFSGPLLSHIQFSQVSINGLTDGDIQTSPSSDIKIVITGFCKEDLEYFRTGITILVDGIKLFSLHQFPEPRPIKKGAFAAEFIIQKYLLRPGNYSLSIFGHDDGNNRKGQDWIYGVEILSFSVLEEWDLINDSHNEGIINVSTHRD